ncbi:MAG: hypothetical protein JNK55_15175 [Rubrivivax sp.]|nr:hypothetical protein [Rubrivivax sp.]
MTQSSIAAYILRNRWVVFIVAPAAAWIRSFIAWPFKVIKFRGVHFGNHVKLIGLRGISIGHNSVIGAGTWLNVNDPKKYPDSIVIGENCFIGQDSLLTAGRSIAVRDYCLTARGVALIGAAHAYSDPSTPYSRSGVTSESRIYIGVNCFIGLGARIVGDVSIGHGSVIGAGAEVRDSIPCFSLVVGSPARPIKRYDFSLNEWVSWPRDDYTGGPNEDEYLRKLQQQHRWIIQPIAAAWRGKMNSL